MKPCQRPFFKLRSSWHTQDNCNRPRSSWLVFNVVVQVHFLNVDWLRLQLLESIE